MQNNSVQVLIQQAVYADSTYTDEDLAAIARERGAAADAALSALLKRYDVAVFKACRGYLRDSPLAQDASQEVLLKIARGISRFQGRSSFRTWLYTIVRNECFNAENKRQRIVARHEAMEPADLDRFEARDHLGLETSLELQTSVDHVIQTLSRKDREVLVLRFFNELSLDVIARFLNISLSAAKMRLYRALERFSLAYISLDDCAV